ncbi:GVQW3 protein, partial [Acromyrmex insinuator]
MTVHVKQDFGRGKNFNIEQRSVIKFNAKLGIKKVRDLVANDRNASLKMMEEALNISRETMRTILHEDLSKTKICAKFVPHTLRTLH